MQDEKMCSLFCILSLQVAKHAQITILVATIWEKKVYFEIILFLLETGINLYL